MNRILIFSICVLSLFSCTQNNVNQTVSHETNSYKVIELIDSIVSLYPNLYVNDVHNERFLLFLYMELDKKLTEDNTFLAEVPMCFSQMLKKGDKYILKFECGKYTTNDNKLISQNSDTQISYAIFAEVDADFASTLENESIYTLTGNYKGYVDGKLELPSGKVFNYERYCRKYGKYDPGSVCLGGLLFDDISVIKIKSKNSY